MGTNETRSDWESGQDVPWTLLEYDELADAYGAVVEPALRAEGKQASERPSYEWLSANGFRGLTYALREYHDTTFATWWEEAIGDSEDTYDWPTDHGESVQRLEEFLRNRSRGRQWSERTIESKRYRLARYVRAYTEETGREDLLAPVALDADVRAHEAIAEGSATFARLDDELGRVRLGRIFEVVDNWYDYLVTKHLAGVNPVKAVEGNYTFETGGDDQPTNPALEPDHVRALVEAAESRREKLVLVAICGWGLRSGEVAAMHVSQFALEGNDPHIAFDERKNGPGQVNLLYGIDVLEGRISDLPDRDGWNGYLLPSKRSESGHVGRGRINEWFDQIIARASVPDRIGGRKPVPQMGRRFWYDAYSATVGELLAHVDEIASEQGSASAEVVHDEYLSPERKRSLRREFMTERLQRAFEGRADDL